MSGDEKKLSFLKVMDYITERRKALEAGGLSYSAYEWEWHLFDIEVQKGTFDVSDDEIEKKIRDEINEGIKLFVANSKYFAEIGPITTRKLHDGKVYGVAFGVQIKEAE